jgi:hypothetical protein
MSPAMFGTITPVALREAIAETYGRTSKRTTLLRYASTSAWRLREGMKPLVQ